MPVNSPESPELIYFISGMWCSTCAKTIREAVIQIEGVQSADINYASKLLVVHPNSREENSVVDNEVQVKIAHIGFGVRRLSEGWLASFQDTLSKESEKKISWIQVSTVWFLAMWSSMIAFAGYIGGALTTQETYNLSLLSSAFGIPAILLGILPYANSGLRALFLSKLMTLDFFIFIGGCSAMGASLLSLWNGQSVTYADSGSMVIAILLLTKKIENTVITATATRLLYQLGPKEDSVEVLKKEAWTKATVSQIKVGDRIRLVPGQTLSLDGILDCSSAEINNHLVNGEAMPVTLQHGDHVFAGAIAHSPLQLKVTAPLGKRKIDTWAESALLSRSGKSRYEKFTSKMESGLSWIALSGAVSAAGFAFSRGASASSTTEAFFVGILVFCPCLFASIIPLTRQITRSALMRAGVFLQSDDALWDLPKMSHFFFDKTGTLESVEPHFIPLLEDDERVKPYLKALAINSSHITFKGLAIEGPAAILNEMKEFPGLGLSATATDGTQILAGKPEFLKSFGLDVSDMDPALSPIAINQQIVGWILRKEIYDSKAHIFLTKLKNLVPSCHIEILSGDPNPNAGQSFAKISETILYRGNLSPEEKASRVLANAEDSVFVGDGLNDTLALSKARVSFRLGDRTQNFAPVDFHLKFSNPDLILASIQYAKKYRTVIVQTILAAFFYNLSALTLAAFGRFSPLGAVLSMLLSFSLMLLSISRLQFREKKVPCA